MPVYGDADQEFEVSQYHLNRHTRLSLMPAQSLINSLELSITSLTQLIKPAAIRKCGPSQYERLLACMYAQLRSRNIPYEQVYTELDNLHLQSLCLSAIGITFPIWLSCRAITERLVQGLIRHWQSGIRQWIIFFHDKIIKQDNLSM